MPKPIIEVRNLVKRYGETAAVDNVTFSVAEGQVFGFLGPNGAGKTTTMRILSTLLKKTSGVVTVDGHNVDTEADAIRHSIGFALQNISLDNMASAWENLQLLGVLYGLTPGESRKRADELLEIVGLTKVADTWVNSYSGGMRRRLDLAGVLMHSPKILFLDEPTEGLDPQARRTIWDYLRQLNKDGSTIFLTTHYMDEADALCEELAFIDKGTIIKSGTPSALKSQLGGDLVTLVFATEKEAAQAETVAKKAIGGNHQIKGTTLTITVAQADKLAPKLITTLDAAKLSPVSLGITKPSLEDVFVSLVGHSLEDDAQLVTGRDPFVEGRN